MKTKTAFFCSSCGCEEPKWFGRCPSCGEWGTCVEEVVSAKPDKGGSHAGALQLPGQKEKPRRLSEIEGVEEPRIDLHDEELNRVLGGGLVPGSMVLLGGDPGIGKSTLVLQTVMHINDKRVLYVSGEESAYQLKMRAERLAAGGPMPHDCYIVCETSLDGIFTHIANVSPELVIIDSIQTIATDDLESSAGSVGQIRECASRILKFAKESGTPVILIGHITKEGALAGPQSAGTYRRYCPPVRGRSTVYVPHSTGYEKPFRINVRTGYLRNADYGAAPGDQSLGTAAQYQA